MTETEQQYRCCQHFIRIMRQTDISDQNRTYWIQSYLSMAQEEDYSDLYQVIFDYLKIPKDLSFKQRIAYFQLVGVVIPDE